MPMIWPRSARGTGHQHFVGHHATPEWSAFFSLSNIRKDSRLESFDFALVAFIKCPLFDALSADQPGLGQYLEVLTDCWLTHPKFLSDQYAAHSILDQIAIDLRRKMFGRRAKPRQNLQPPLIRNRAEHMIGIH